MARHDREDSHLEDQLAWLDAIKEMPDEVEIAVSAVTSTTLAGQSATPSPAEPESASPYPADPWRLVSPEPPSSRLVRAADDDVTGSGPVTSGDHATERPGDSGTGVSGGRGVAVPGGQGADEAGVDGLAGGQRAVGGQVLGAPLADTDTVPDSSVRESGYGDPSSLSGGSTSSFSDLPFGEVPFSRSTFKHSPADTDSYSIGGFSEADTRQLSADAPGASSAEEPVRGWLEPAVPVEPVKPDPITAEPVKAEGFTGAERFTVVEPEPARADTLPTVEPTTVEQVSGTPAEAAFPADKPPVGGDVAKGVGPFGPPDGGSAFIAPPPKAGTGLTDGRFTGSLRDDLAAGQRAAAAERTAAQFDTNRGMAEPKREEEREPYQPRRRHTPPPASPFAPPPGAGAGAISVKPGNRPNIDSLDPATLLRGRRNAPAKGWRRLVYKATAGMIKPGESAEVRRRRELVAQARTPVANGHHRVAVLSLKGGVGKTTTTVGLGATLAQVRGDRVIAVDANPDRGTLSDKVELETSATVRDLLNERHQIKRYVDIRAFTSQTPSRLEILASDRDPSVSEAFSASDYHAVAQVLENFYSICITDCGTGLLHSAMSGVLGMADQIVLVTSPSVDGARAASATLDWLEAHEYADLVRAATVVICSVRPRSKSTVDLDKLEAYFAARCRAVVRVPYDPHLEEGAEMDLDQLQQATRDAYLRLAARVGDGFAGPQERRFSEIPDHL